MVRKALEINRLKTLNETDKTFKDNGNYVIGNRWKPYFWNIGNHQTVVLTLKFALV